MTAGTVVITGGILATVILLCIIAVLCYCRLQVCPQRPPANPVPVLGAETGGPLRVTKLKAMKREGWELGVARREPCVSHTLYTLGSPEEAVLGRYRGIVLCLQHS